MVNAYNFFLKLMKNDITFFTGVPDSLLKDFSSVLIENCNDKQHIIAANEGNALALASGYHLATNKIALVYMQNSGIGNMINPLLSLNDELVYGIPALILIGWRGQNGIKDEPQHVKQGMITEDIIKTLGVKYYIIDKNMIDDDIEQILIESIKYMKKTNKSVSIIVKKGTFFNDNKVKEKNNEELFLREEALEIILDNANKNSVFISTTGKTSREVFEIRERKKQLHNKDFLTVGSMGHCSQIALAVSLYSEKSVYCIDGEGAMLMHMGAMAVNGTLAQNNFIHIVINNGVHESVGNQKNYGAKINITKIAKACNYKNIYSIDNSEVLKKILNECKNINNGNVFIEIKVSVGSRSNLGRPSHTPEENKKIFMDYLGSEL